MEELEKSTKKRYLLFIATIVLIIIAAVLFFQNRINILTSDVSIINISGKKRMLSQRITKQVFSLDLDQSDRASRIYLDSLSALITEWQNNQDFLILANKQVRNSERIDSLFAAA